MFVTWDEYDYEANEHNPYRRQYPCLWEEYQYKEDEYYPESSYELRPTVFKFYVHGYPYEFAVDFKHKYINADDICALADKSYGYWRKVILPSYSKPPPMKILHEIYRHPPYRLAGTYIPVYLLPYLQVWLGLETILSEVELLFERIN